MAITRRQFIKRTSLAAAGTFLGPSLFRNPLLQQALADTIGDKFFVVVFLDGGNDGLNTITPVSGTLRSHYQTVRTAPAGGVDLLLPTSGAGALLQPANAFLDSTGAQLGFHPGLTGLKNLYDLANPGKVAVIQGCGYPEYSLSHDDSRHAWQTGNPLASSSFAGGWMGRYLAANYTGSDIPGVNIRSNIAGEFIQYTTSVLALNRVANLDFPYDDYNGADATAKETAFKALYQEAKASLQGTVKYVGDTGKAFLDATVAYNGLTTDYNPPNRLGGPTYSPIFPPGTTWNEAYKDVLRNEFARDLREVAKVILGVKNNKVSARFFEVANGGYDTHSDQGTGNSGEQQYDLHQQVGDAIELFYHDLVDMGLQDKVCILVWSEFSRRIRQNETGTDHGSQGPMFVIGGKVKGGAYGNHPNINPGINGVLDDDGNTVYWQGGANPKNWTRSTDIRDVYGTILRHWLGFDGLGGHPDPSSILPIDGGDPTIYWTAPNFDMTFLP